MLPKQLAQSQTAFTSKYLNMLPDERSCCMIFENTIKQSRLVNTPSTLITDPRILNRKTMNDTGHSISYTLKRYLMYFR